MQFRVPQFLNIEDKVFGPFTFKQFGYLLGAIAFAYIFWKLIPKFIAIPLILLVSGNFLALAFLEINGRKYGDVLESAIKYFLRPKIFVWQKKQNQFNSFQYSQYNQNKLNESLIKQEKEKIENEKRNNKKHYNLNEIKDLSRKLDILDIKNNYDDYFYEEEQDSNYSLREKLLREKNHFRI